jgi:hypothetical protein
MNVLSLVNMFRSVSIEYPKRDFFASFPNFCVYYTASIFTNCGVSYIRHESLQGMFLISS